MTNNLDSIILELHREIDCAAQEYLMPMVQTKVSAVQPSDDLSYTNLIVAGLFLTGIVYLAVYFLTDL